MMKETFEKAIRGKFLDVIHKGDYNADDVASLLNWKATHQIP